MTALAHVPNGWRRGASVSTFTLQAVQESNHARRRIWSPSGYLSLRPVAPGVGDDPTSTPVTAERLANFAFPGIADALTDARALLLQFSEIYSGSRARTCIYGIRIRFPAN